MSVQKPLRLLPNAGKMTRFSCADVRCRMQYQLQRGFVLEIVKTRATAEELLQMPDDGFRYELVRGEMRRMNPAGNIHGRIAMSFSWCLAQYVEENDLGEVYAAGTGFKIAPKKDYRIVPAYKDLVQSVLASYVL